MTHSKLTHSLLFVAALAAFAVTGAGCAMNAGEPTVEESTNASETDLRVAPAATANVEAANTLSDDSTGASEVVLPKANVAPLLLLGPQDLVGGGKDDDGPRPHPWQPAPETANETTNSGSSSGSSATK